jgi:signal transduction histidine kinase
MTLPQPTLPPPRRWSSVRTLLLVMFLIAALYAGALPVYLLLRIRTAESVLAQGTEAVIPMLEDLTRRVDMVDRTRHAAERAVERRGPFSHAPVDSLGRFLSSDPSGARAQQVAAAPSDLGRAVARSDSQLSEIAAALTATAALIAGRRWDEAAARLRVVDSLDAAADRQGLRVASIARHDMLAPQQAVEAVTAEALRDTALWLALGLVLLWLGLVAIRRRILQPLSALDTGLARVSDGDLNTRVPVLRSDELGRLGAHFNEMTQILLGRAEEQGRFTAAGQLLADVAHEVGNPLMAIAAHAESRIGDAAVGPGEREEMQQILRQAQRATKLLRGLVRFVRPTQRQVTTLNLNDLVRGALDIVSYRFGVDEITVGGELDPGLPAVRGDALALEQVVVNLLSNAIDALRAVKPPRRLTVDSWVSDGKVSLGVADNGSGVAAEIADRLFRPFASTKGRRGTGLGLYVSRQIVREAGGDLVLEARPGTGARFVATLQATSVAGPTPPPAPLAVGGAAPAQRLAGVRILLVDDEEAVRRPMAKFLTRRGAQVYEAGDGVQALALLGRQAVDVILADLRMPRMSGPELFATLERDRPQLAGRVLFLSGDVSQLSQPGSTPLPRERVLVKPVELAELERRVSEFMTASGPA